MRAARLGDWLRAFLGADSGRASLESMRHELRQLRVLNYDLEERLAWSDARLKAIVDRQYAIEQQFSVEHFELSESRRNLRDESLRLAAALADRSIILARAGTLQARISDLKQRLARYEAVDDSFFDEAPLAKN
jgi:chromosome segregation ATPase